MGPVEVDRRRLLASAGLGAALLGGMAATPALAAPAQRFPYRTLPLWPGAAPGAENVTVTQRSVLRSANSAPDDLAWYGITRPTLTLVQPARPNGTALLMIPGGGYERIAASPDGGGIAHHLAGMGFHVGMLLYRLPYDGWAAGPDAPLQDAQRALRILRAETGAGRTGTIGFSAGGHLAGALATRHGDRTYPAIDAIDEGSARPDFAALMFAVVTMTDPHAHGPSRKNLIGAEPSADLIRRHSIEQDLPDDLPPMFLSAAVDDRVVPVENTLILHAALKAKGVNAPCHIFDVGGHGFGSVDDPGGPGHFWPLLLADWLGRQA
ncbi:alpha/beta hydrolase [Croceibacterium sp. TMG7-5b_MA50]|uniref:alpha/beta hydrolase n=1 Tax=Croceibacterium sp. TMG7-5b_MA50 TaxID=3121290 RepID=UPI003221DE9C